MASWTANNPDSQLNFSEWWDLSTNKKMHEAIALGVTRILCKSKGHILDNGALRANLWIEGKFVNIKLVLHDVSYNLLASMLPATQLFCWPLGDSFLIECKLPWCFYCNHCLFDLQQGIFGLCIWKDDPIAHRWFETVVSWIAGFYRQILVRPV